MSWEGREYEKLHQDARRALEGPGRFTRELALWVLRLHLPIGPVKESNLAGVKPLEDPPARGVSYHILWPMIAKAPYGEHAV